MQKDRAGFGILYMIAVVVVTVGIGGAGWYVYQTQHRHSTNPAGGFSYGQADPSQPTASKQQVIAAADKFLIVKVGQQKSQELYKREPNRDSFANPEQSTFDFIAYHFSPMKMYQADNAGSDTDIVYVQVNRNNLREIYADFVPDCTKDANQCNFVVSNQKALDIAKQHGLPDVAYVNIGSLPGHTTFALRITSCTNKKSIFIDYSNGKVLGTQPAITECDPDNI